MLSNPTFEAFHRKNTIMEENSILVTGDVLAISAGNSIAKGCKTFQYFYKTIFSFPRVCVVAINFDTIFLRVFWNSFRRYIQNFCFIFRLAHPHRFENVFGVQACALVQRIYRIKIWNSFWNRKNGRKSKSSKNIPATARSLFLRLFTHTLTK